MIFIPRFGGDFVPAFTAAGDTNAAAADDVAFAFAFAFAHEFVRPRFVLRNTCDSGVPSARSGRVSFDAARARFFAAAVAVAFGGLPRAALGAGGGASASARFTAAASAGVASSADAAAVIARRAVARAAVVAPAVAPVARSYSARISAGVAHP